jgi:hypothetical protein
MTILTNLTPHAIHLHNAGHIETLPSVGVARVTETRAPVGAVDGLPLEVASHGAVEGLPEPREGVLLIVSAMVRSALPDRTDLASPGEVVRDAAGKVVGCRTLTVNRPAPRSPLALEVEEHIAVLREAVRRANEADGLARALATEAQDEQDAANGNALAMDAANARWAAGEAEREARALMGRSVQAPPDDLDLERVGAVPLLERLHRSPRVGESERGAISAALRVFAEIESGALS